MKIGVVYPQIELGGDPDAVRRIGLATEELGYDYLLAYDHVVGATHDREPKLWGPYTDQDPFHDPFVMFAYLAGLTKKIELVSGVLILPQRQTVLVAQQAADLDLLSGERFRMGVGVGWNYVEYDALGQDFTKRGKRADEQIPFIRKLWSEPLVTFKGDFDMIDRGNINPRPKRQIPIWIGGFGEHAFRRGAKLGDGFIFAGKVEDAQKGKEAVSNYLKEYDRSVDGYGMDFLPLFSKDLNDAVESIKKWEDLGGTHGAVVTMSKELKTTDAHIDFIADVKAKL